MIVALVLWLLDSFCRKIWWVFVVE